MPLTKKDAEERLRPLYAKVLAAVEDVGAANEASIHADIIHANRVLVNRQSEYIAEANEIIRQGVA